MNTTGEAVTYRQTDRWTDRQTDTRKRRKYIWISVRKDYPEVLVSNREGKAIKYFAYLGMNRFLDLEPVECHLISGGGNRHHVFHVLSLLRRKCLIKI